jgi:hypothetical protein
MCSQSAPYSNTLLHSLAKNEKSHERIEGAIIIFGLDINFNLFKL